MIFIDIYSILTRLSPMTEDKCYFQTFKSRFFILLQRELAFKRNDEEINLATINKKNSSSVSLTVKITK